MPSLSKTNFKPSWVKQVPRKVTKNKAFYDSPAWRRFRYWFLNRHPVCVYCGKEANTVHHKVPVEEGGARLDEENCESVCKPCHQRAHNRLRK